MTASRVSPERRRRVVTGSAWAIDVSTEGGGDMHAFRRLIQQRIDERGETSADVARRAGLSKQTLHSILTDDRPAIREMPSRKTVQGLAAALQMSADQLLIAAAEAYGVPVSRPVVVPSVIEVTDSELARELMRRALARESVTGTDRTTSLDLTDIDGESLLAVVQLRRGLLDQAISEAAGRPGLARTLEQLASIIAGALDEAAKKEG
ncbi:MAG: helix-turn-helix domain-containing protein [Jatrophihabitantaceae bacterium]